MREEETVCVTISEQSAPRAEAEPMKKSIRMCIIVTVDITIQNLCRGRLEYFLEHGFEVTVVCAPTPMADAIKARGVHLHTAPLSRAITPIRDLRALWNLYRFLRREQFDLIEVSTPKAAVIGSLAARLAGARCVVHLLRGLAYAERNGLLARVVRMSQKIACRLSHRVISISTSTLEQACRDGVCSHDKIVVLGQGSSNGIDLEQFSPRDAASKSEVRRRLDIPDNGLVVGFVGRMTGDKGLVELVDAFVALHKTLPHLFLLLVGDYEKRDRPPERVVETVASHPGIKHVGWQEETPPYFAAMDIFVLPTHREGFGTVLLEAAAMQLPIVTTRAVGAHDAVEDGVTAFRVPVADTKALLDSLAKLADDPALRRQMGTAGRSRVERLFDCRTVWSLQEREFHRLLGR